MSQTSQDLVLNEVEKLIETTRETYKDVKRFAISQAWKILQLYIAATIQIIEIIATDLSSPEKKELAMNMIDKFYDSVFLVVDVPFVPSIIESYLHVYVKRFLMILVSSTIDSMVKIFREVGVFKPKLVYNQNFLK
jgi:uncharacterized protein YutE (UPF0331/DUF86 family)